MPLGAREHQLNVLYAASVPVVQRRCDPDRLNHLLDRTRGFNHSRLLVYNIRVRHIAAASMGLAGQCTAQQNEHVAEETLVVSEDPIA
jgi:hypothetical protein